MSYQYSIEFPSGEDLRDEAIQRALDHADQEAEKWSDHAYEFLLKYMEEHPTFMTEDVRLASSGIIPEPPSQRAWGGIVRRASQAGLIMSTRTQSVKNPAAHCANAAVWSVNYELRNNKVA